MTTECSRTLAYAIEDSATDAYIDLAQSLSFTNRKLYRQGRCYYIQKIQWMSGNSLTGGSLASKLTLNTLPMGWVVRNSWVKAFALWKQMNKSVLSDNPSVQGKWADFKVFFDVNHANGDWGSAGPTLNLKPFTGDQDGAQFINDGEWYMSDYVTPQHDVVQATGVEAPADKFKCHMLGADIPDPADATEFKSVGIVNGYQDTRARVQIAPDVPATMSTNWMTQLTDEGGQDPELADVIEDANDAPPYDLDEYPGGATNWNKGVIQTTMLATATNQVDKDIGFCVPLGLLKVTRTLINNTNGGVLLITVAPGNYHGVMATEMKQ